MAGVGTRGLRGSRPGTRCAVEALRRPHGASKHGTAMWSRHSQCSRLPDKEECKMEAGVAAPVS